MNLKKIGNVFTSKFVGTGPSTYDKRIYRAAVSQRLRSTAIGDTPVHTIAQQSATLRPWHRFHQTLRLDEEDES